MNTTWQPLIVAANEIKKYAYAPYSHFSVGAAVQGISGKIYKGCNVENASYGLTCCAERNAIFHGVAEGEQQFLALAVAADSADYIVPCGACLQVIREFHIPTVIMTNAQGEYKTVSLKELLPYGFDETFLLGRNK